MFASRMSIPRHSKGTLCGMKTYEIFFSFFSMILDRYHMKKRNEHFEK